MKRSVTFRPRARRDLLEQMLYLGQEADTGAQTAERYHHAVLTTCEILASHPLRGRLLSMGTARLQKLRRFRVSHPFGNYLIFYMPTTVGIDVVRVLHGPRDIETILAGEDRE